MKGKLDRVAVFDSGDRCPELPLVEGAGIARAVVWPGVGANIRSMHRIKLAAGGQTVEQKHPGEAVYFVLSGAGDVREGRARQMLIEGSMVHIEPGTRYRFKAGAKGIDLVGGPCPPDSSLYDQLK